MKVQKKKKHDQVGGKIKSEATAVTGLVKWQYSVALIFIILLTCIIYQAVFHNGLLAWDDENYIKNNSLVHSINLKQIFTQNVEGNYHPLTILILALEYQFFGLNETGYHSINLILHLLNVLLVFFVILRLCNKAEVALVASLLFGIHPIHVESVAWAAELKDLLYTFLFLSSYIFYLKYLNEFRKKFIIISLLLFLLSLLSKAMAASLPMVLLLTDYYKGRKINMNTLIEKVPYFLLSLIFGLIAVFAQKSSGATDVYLFTFIERIIFACYGFITYLYKLLLPLHLSAFYPYPIKGGESIPFPYYAFLLLFLILAAYVFYSSRFSKKIIFGLGFFSFTIFLVLQILPVGGAIMADRYSYIPSIGIFYLAGEGINLLWKKNQKWISVLLIGVFSIFFSIKTFARCKVWENGITLWNDVIKQYPKLANAYNNRGVVYLNDKNNRLAFDDFSKAIEFDKLYAQAYYNRGSVYMIQKEYEQALKDYSKAIELQPKNTEAYVNRGNVFRDTEKYNEALIDYKKAIELNPGFAIAYFNRGTLFMRLEKHDDAISDFSIAIRLKSDYAKAYCNRGLAEFYSGKKDVACMDIKQSIRYGFKPPDDVFEMICK